MEQIMKQHRKMFRYVEEMLYSYDRSLSLCRLLWHSPPLVSWSEPVAVPLWQKLLGEGKEKEANRYFSMLIYLTIFGGIVLSILGILLARPVSIALGASGDL